MMPVGRVCMDKLAGGLAIKNIRAFNLALLGKWLWHLGSMDRTLWIEVILSKYFRQGKWSDFSPDASYHLSAVWKGLLLAADQVKAGT